MFLALQFPISDARAFQDDRSLRLALPEWPNPVTDIRPQFVHYFGRAVERRRQADQAWPDEIKLCKAKRALRFPDLAKGFCGLPGAQMYPACAFRRLFCDGLAVVRLEVGFVHDRRKSKLVGLNLHRILAIADDLCTTTTLVPQISRAPAQASLLRQGSALARLYARATLATSTPERIKLSAALVKEGNPLLIIEVESEEVNFQGISEGFAKVNPSVVHGADLHFGRLNTRAGVVRTWILRRGSATKSQARSLRLCLMRLHAEQESLDLVLKQVRRLLSPTDPSVIDDLDDYFNKRTRLINRGAWGEIDQSAILAAFDAAEQVRPPATRLNLVDRYDGARTQIWKKIEDYQARRAAVRLVSVTNVLPGGINVEKQTTINQSGTGNILNVAEFMQNVSNTVTNNLQNSSASDEAQALVRKLSDQLKAIADKADPGSVQKMGKNLKKLSEEMAEPEPDRAWYEVSLKGLKDAAAAVGAIAQPLAETVGKLWPLLLGS